VDLDGCRGVSSEKVLGVALEINSGDRVGDLQVPTYVLGPYSLKSGIRRLVVPQGCAKVNKRPSSVT
jgi:hypothetical protein